jgi:hypothetical protein
LWTCEAPESIRQVKNKFHHSLETISRKFTKVLEALMRLAFHFVRLKDPQFGTIHHKLEEPRFWPHQLYLYFYDPLSLFSTHTSYPPQQSNHHYIITK